MGTFRAEYLRVSRSDRQYCKAQQERDFHGEANTATAEDMQGFTNAGAVITVDAAECQELQIPGPALVGSKRPVGAPSQSVRARVDAAGRYLESAFFAFFAAGSRGFGSPTCCHVGTPGVGGKTSICTSFTCTRAMPPLWI